VGAREELGLCVSAARQFGVELNPVPGLDGREKRVRWGGERQED
jgi:hypothetical protein